MMHKTVLYSVVLLCFTGTAILSCSKEENNDKEKPVITISLPHPNESIVLNGDSVHVMINISDNDKLQSFTAELKTDSGDTWFTDSRNLQDFNFYVFHRHYNPVGLSANTLLILTATAVDKAGNTENTTLNFSVAP
jgi:hypothetical protein